MVAARNGTPDSRLDLIMHPWAQRMTAEAELEGQIATSVRDKWHQTQLLLSLSLSLSLSLFLSLSNAC
jgi:hypothetical protein